MTALAKRVNAEMGAGEIFAVAKESVDAPVAELEKLLDSPRHEVKVLALSIMDKKARKKSLSDGERGELFELYMRRHDDVDSWDLVDLGAPWVVGRYLADKPRDVLYELARSSDPWRRRTAIVACLYFIRQGEVDDTFAIAEILVNEEHDLVRKATGGLLREAGKKDTTKLLSFLDKHSSVMPRVMLRYSIERLDPAQKAHYLGSTRVARTGR